MQKALTTTRFKQFTLLIFTTICILTEKLVGITTLLKTGINDYYIARSQGKSGNIKSMILIFPL